MIFELHITVDHNHPDFLLTEWTHFCEQADIKPLDIRLVSGKHERQVMFAAVTETSEDAVTEWVARLTASVISAGFVPIRTKLEVPLDKAAFYKNPAYHECHIKSLIPKDLVQGVVDTLVDAGWHASYNALYKDYAGVEKWYFTQRSYGEHFIQAGRDFAEVFNALTEINWYTVRMESETVLTDSNPLLDEGWA